MSVTRREGLRDHVEIIHRSGFLSFVKRLTTSKEPSYRTPHSFHEQVGIAYVKTKWSPPQKNLTHSHSMSTSQPLQNYEQLLTVLSFARSKSTRTAAFMKEIEAI